MCNLPGGKHFKLIVLCSSPEWFSLPAFLITITQLPHTGQRSGYIAVLALPRMHHALPSFSISVHVQCPYPSYYSKLIYLSSSSSDFTFFSFLYILSRVKQVYLLCFYSAMILPLFSHYYNYLFPCLLLDLTVKIQSTKMWINSSLSPLYSV